MSRINVKDTCVHRKVPEVTVVSITPREENEDGTTKFAGVVKFLNHVGAECIMTVNQFDMMYTKKS